MSRDLKYFIGSLVFLLLTAFLFNRFLDWHEHRPGITFNDPFFTLFKGQDCSLITFILLYFSIGSFLFTHRKDFYQLSLLAFAYAAVIILRMFSLWLLPFYADWDAVKLNDPFLNTFIYPGNYVARDLFFSGHVAILVLLVLYSDNKKWRWFYILMSVLVGIAVVLQKVHFSIDVVAAPFFAMIAYWSVRKIIDRK